MSIFSTAASRSGNRIFTPAKKGESLPAGSGTGRKLPVGKDARRPVCTPSVRLTGGRMEVSSHWLMTRYRISADALADVLDEMTSWGQGVEWFALVQFQQACQYTKLGQLLSETQQLEVSNILKGKGGVQP